MILDCGKASANTRGHRAHPSAKAVGVDDNNDNSNNGDVVDDNDDNNNGDVDDDDSAKKNNCLSCTIWLFLGSVAENQAMMLFVFPHGSRFDSLPWHELVWI